MQYFEGTQYYHQCLFTITEVMVNLPQSGSKVYDKTYSSLVEVVKLKNKPDP